MPKICQQCKNGNELQLIGSDFIEQWTTPPKVNIFSQQQRCPFIDFYVCLKTFYELALNNKFQAVVFAHQFTASVRKDSFVYLSAYN